MTKIKISPLVFVFAVVMVFLGYGFTLIGYFVAVVMHEMAHAEVARKRGYVLGKIKIMPYGASLTGEFEGMNCRDEFLIAVAGPLSNVFIAVLFTAVWWLAPAAYFFTEDFVFSNIFTALTNLLPIFPLDGGRALLAIMSRKLPRQKAYKVIRYFGYVVCAGFCALFVCSVFYSVNFSFALMAFFVLTGTLFPDKNSKYQRLYGMAYRSEKLKHGLTVREIMVSDELTLDALSKMLNGSYYCKFDIVNSALEHVAYLSETKLENCLTGFGRDTKVRELPSWVFSA